MKQTHLQTLVIVIGVIALGALGLSATTFFRGLPQAQVTRMMSGEGFDTAIDQGITRYIQKQQQNDEQAQADQQKKAAEQAKNVPGLQASDHVRDDNRSADVLLIEYSDFECPFCHAFDPTAKEFVKKYPNVAWVYRQFPLNIHAGAQKKAEASECVAKLGGNTAFWNFSDALIKAGTQYPVKDLGKLAQGVGVNETAFQKCLDSDEMATVVSAQTQTGLNSGVTGTPGNILLNTKTGKVRPIAGNLPLATLEAALQEVLAE